MDMITPIAGTLLIAIALVLILFPLWQKTRETNPPVNRIEQKMVEYETRYQAALQSVKNLVFDYEMGKISDDDYPDLLKKAKLSAAMIRRDIDKLNGAMASNDVVMSAKVDMFLKQAKNQAPNKALLAEVEAEIKQIKENTLDMLTCPNCQKAIHEDDAFCSGCGQSLHSTCSACGATYQAGDAFCAECGESLKLSNS